MPLKAGQTAPDFRLQSHLGTPVSLSNYRGRNVVLAYNAGRSWSIPAILLFLIMAVLIAIVKGYAG